MSVFEIDCFFPNAKNIHWSKPFSKITQKAATYCKLLLYSYAVLFFLWTDNYEKQISFLA